MRYTSKQIIERALNLADIANTDFLTHTELTQYINDAWQTVYQWLINKGDKQFVKEVILETAGSFHNWTEFEIPKDLYQVCSIKNKMSGHIVERAAESESINSGKYDIINNRIRLYGNSQGPLLLTYWTVPTFISFPDKVLDYDKRGEIYDFCNNSVLLENGDIYNVVTNELIATISIQDFTTYHLGSSYYVEETDVEFNVKDFDGNLINTISKEADTTYHLFPTYKGNIYYQEFSNGEYSAPKSIVSGITMLNRESHPKYLTNKEDYWIYYDEADSSLVIYSEFEDANIGFLDVPTIRADSFTWTNDFNNQPAFYITSTDNKIYLFTFNSDGEIEYDQLRLRPELIRAKLRYGVLTNDAAVYSVIPDTELNFPNELYFSLLACDLALRFAMKMNANTDGLNNLYQNMQTTFMNTLSQADSYTRIRNCY